jgi:hypothetical protein
MQSGATGRSVRAFTCCAQALFLEECVASTATLPRKSTRHGALDDPLLLRSGPVALAPGSLGAPACRDLRTQPTGRATRGRTRSAAVRAPCTRNDAHRSGRNRACAFPRDAGADRLHRRPARRPEGPAARPAAHHHGGRCGGLPAGNGRRRLPHPVPRRRARDHHGRDDGCDHRNPAGQGRRVHRLQRPAARRDPDPRGGARASVCRAACARSRACVTAA